MYVIYNDRAAVTFLYQSLYENVSNYHGNNINHFKDQALSHLCSLSSGGRVYFCTGCTYCKAEWTDDFIFICVPIYNIYILTIKMLNVIQSLALSDPV